MDKESEERMAPALHNADHEAAGTIITSLKYPSGSPPSSIEQSETDTFQQFNGVLSSHGQIGDEQMLAKSNQYLSSLKFESPSKTMQIGSSGDFGSAISYFEGTVPQKIGSFHIGGSGDATKYMKTEISNTYSEEPISNANNKKTFSKTAVTSSLLDPATSSVKDTSSTSHTLDTAVEVHKLLQSMNDKVVSSDLPTSLNDIVTPISSFATDSLTSQKLDNKLISSTCPPLLVNVDKHNSVNPQIIHTTSITTSPLAVLNRHQWNEDKHVEHENGRTLSHHKNNFVKSHSASPTNFLSKRNGGAPVKPLLYNSKFHAEVGDKDEQADDSQNRGESSSVSSNTIDHERDSLEFHLVSCGVSKLSVAISSNPLTVISQTEVLTKAVGAHAGGHETRKNIICSEKQSSSSDDTTVYPVHTPSIGSNSIDTVHTANSTVHNYTGDTQASMKEIAVATALETSLLNESTASSIQANMSSITQTTPVYKCHDSISSCNVQQRTSSTTSGTSTSTNSKDSGCKDDLSLQNVSDLMNLAHGLVTGKHMQQLPLNVTNTLQELAASLARKQENESDLTHQNEAADDNISINVHKSYNLNDGGSDFHQNVITDLKNLETQHHSQLSEISKRKADLENRISSLQLRLNRIRAAGVSLHSKRHLQNFKSLRSETRSSSSWKHKSLYAASLGGSGTNNHEFHIKLEADDSRHDSILKKPKNHSSSAISSKLGVLKKELRHVRTKVDPYLTESSSDEDESMVSSNKLSGSIESSIDLRIPSHFPNNTAAWTWAHDRVSIAHRWTWLIAQVTGLEFKIKQHRELQKQLRAAKGEVTLGSYIIDDKLSHSPTAAKVDQEPSFSTTNSNLDDVKPNSSSDPTGRCFTDDISWSISKNDEAVEASTCARARPLLHRLRHRRILRTSDIVGLSDKKLKLSTVHNDNDIMRSDQPKHTPFHRADGRSRGIVHSSMRSRAAMHDHSYHRILSTPEDVPISARLNGHLFTSNKQFASKLRRAERRSDKRNKRKRKEAMHRGDRTPEKVKSRPRSATMVLERADKLMRSMSTLQRNTSFEDRSAVYEITKRRSTNSLSEFNKRSRVTSLDSDVESLHNRSEAGTPVFDSSGSHHNNPQYQAVLKRKRANDQAYDINNIVIPHGLTSTRIEKLQYKEILTPGWRTTNSEGQDKDDSSTDENNEDVSDELFKCRHDRHEILEKKKYMSYMERNMNKRSGARTMSRANLPYDDSPSFFPSSYRSSPTSSFAPSDFPAPASPEPLSPSVVLRSRRSSSEQSFHSNVSNQPSERHRAHDSVSSDDGIQKVQRENSTFECWEQRNFPLNQHEVDDIKNDPVVFLKKLSKEVESGRMFQPITGHGTSHDGHVTPKQKLSKLELVASKRQRNNSHTSNLSRDDERHSDDSVMSSRSLHRVRSGASDVSVPTISEPSSSAPLYPQRKRYKATLKDDYYYYSGLESSSGSDTDGDSIISADSKMSKSTASRTGEEWVSRPVSRDSTPKRSPSGDEQAGEDETSPEHKPPLLLKVKKKFLFK